MALYAGGTSLLLRGNGADGSTVFTDETGKIVTAYGNARISTAQSKFGGSSMYFDGSGDWLQVPPNAAFEFGSGDFTIEAWIYLPATPSGSFAAIVDIRSSGINQSGSVLFHVNSARQLGYWSFALVSPVNSLALNTWQHVALCRANGTTILFIHGVVVGSVADTGIKTASQLVVASVYDGLNPAFSGYINDLRITKGVARYTANFTPPASRVELDDVYAAIQPLTPYGPPLAKYNPAIGKPVMQAITTDLTDRLPYGIPNTPFSNNVNLWEFKGRGRVTGTVKEKSLPANTPLRRLVRLHREPDGAFVKATWSDATTGEYVFDGVPPHYRYFVTSFDYSGVYRAVIADNILPDQL